MLKKGYTPLYVACFYGNDKEVNRLLNANADVNLCDKMGRSPLYIASKRNHKRTVNILVNRDADMNLYDVMDLVLFT